VLRGAFAKEDRTAGLGEAHPAGLALVTLKARFGLACFFNVLLLTILKLPIFWTGFIWTKSPVWANYSIGLPRFGLP
jgi:hypothetical protein